MLQRVRWLALEVKDLDAARRFYESNLDLPIHASGDDEVRLGVGDADLVLRRPDGLPRGGLHTHYALSVPRAAYDGWLDRLGDLDPQEHDFGGMRSLYVYDPDGNCVELAGVGDDGDGITGLFEVVFEVADLSRAVAFYRDLGFEEIDREDGERVRLRGPVDLELWEPRLGIADARGGVHVDLGFAGDPDAVREAVGDRAAAVEDLDGGIRLRDPDGHYLTVR